jgi:NitT/TauT family transport system permease protein
MRLLNRRPDAVTRLLLPALPFAAAAAVYFVASSARLADNPDDKLLPGLGAFGRAIARMALLPDPRTGDYLLWTDTAASLQRLFAGLAISTALSFVLGVAIGLLPFVRSTLGQFVAVISMIPPLAVLPIVFIVAGLGEAAKITLIVIGTAPFLMRDLAARVEELPREQLVKAQTLGGTTWQIALRVVVPQMLPRLLDSLRLSLGSAWLFLISAEAIASESGLGYRIFLVRRYFAMDVILPYVAWITLLAFLSDLGLRLLRRAAFPWFGDAHRT